MSSLLLSQSIISSTENSLREKSLQRAQQYQHLGHNFNYHLQRQQLLDADADRRAKDVPKFCWLVFISILVLIFYLVIFTLVALIGYLLFIWIPNDIERNKINNELYDSIINHSNILLIGQLPHEKKILITKNLLIFESKISEDLMNFHTKPVMLQTKFPALFWNEDFRSMIGNSNVNGAVWVDKLGELIFVFIARINETTSLSIRFEPTRNRIRSMLLNSGQWILPISTKDPGTELEIIKIQNGSMKIFINQIDQNRFLCIRNNETIIDLEDEKDHQHCQDDSFQWSFIAGFENGSNLHLITNQQNILIAPENVLYRSGKGYKYELIPVYQFITNGLTPIIFDYFLIGAASTFLLIIIITILKYFIFKRCSNDSSEQPESLPIIYVDRLFSNQNPARTEAKSKFKKSLFSKVFFFDQQNNKQNISNRKQSKNEPKQKPQRKHYLEI